MHTIDNKGNVTSVNGYIFDVITWLAKRSKLELINYIQNYYFGKDITILFS